MIITCDPLYDFTNNEDRKYKWLKSRPICSQCGEHIQDEYGYRLGNDLYCEECVNSWREWIED